MMLMGVSQAAQQVQEEESDRLAAEFDEYVDAVAQNADKMKTEFDTAVASSALGLNDDKKLRAQGLAVAFARGLKER
eukprot:scaffold520482_cov47-Prasinocladus_malaysianus.AAC.1